MAIFKNDAAGFTIHFFLFNTDGTENTTGTPDVVVRGGGGSFATSANTAVRSGSTGSFHLALSQAELNFDSVTIKVTLTGCIPCVTIIYPEATYTSAKAAFVDAAISGRASQTSVDTIDDFLDTEVAAIKAKTDNLPSDPADASDIASSFSTVNTKLDTIDDFLDTEVAAIKAKTDQFVFTVANQVDANALSGSSGPSAETIADAVWDEAISGHLTAGSTGNALNAAGSAGDPWSTPIPGAYGAGTAGKILGDNINATVSSRASQTSLDTVDDFLDTEIAAIKAKTDNLPSDPADASDIASSFTTVNTKLDTIDDLLDTEIPALTSAVAAVQSDTDNIQTRLPAALVSGRMDASVGAVATGAITADGIAADAIGSSELAASAVTEIQSGLATAVELAATKAVAQAGATSAGQIG